MPKQSLLCAGMRVMISNKRDPHNGSRLHGSSHRGMGLGTEAWVEGQRCGLEGQRCGLEGYANMASIPLQSVYVVGLWSGFNGGLCQR